MSNRCHLRQTFAEGLRATIIALFLVALAAAVQHPAAQAASKYAAIVVDQNTGRILYSRNADAHRYPASLTKIMTLYLLFDRMKAGTISLGTRLKVSGYAAGKPPSKVGLKPGQTIRVADAIGALVTKSANDVAAVVAENLGGSEAKFARIMTRQAARLGMTRTRFRNASGLPNKEQVTTARDMATLSRRIRVDFPEYFAYFRTKYFKYRGRRYRNHNRLLFTYKGTEGIKTGYTRASGFNLAASVRRGNKHLVAVVMGGKSAKSRNRHIAYLLNKSWRRASSHRRAARRLKNVPLPARNPLNRVPLPVPAPKPALTASLPPAREAGPDAPASAVAATPQRHGDYHVQVGAYSSQREAIEQLNEVRSRAGKVVAGYDPITMPLPKPKRYLFRARFAGFSEDAARRTCSKLIARKIPCIVMRAE